MVNKVIEGTITLIIIYLLVTNADGFSNIISNVGSVYGASVKALQGR